MAYRLLNGKNTNLSATGAGTVQLGPVPPGVLWEVQRVDVRCTGAIVPIANLYHGDANLGALVDGTSRGDNDVCDGAPSIVLGAGDYLTCTWTGGALAGAVGSCDLWGLLTDDQGRELAP